MSLILDMDSNSAELTLEKCVTRFVCFLQKSALLLKERNGEGPDQS